MGELSFDEVAARYLKRQGAYGRDVRTIHYQIGILRRYFGGMRLADITPPRIEAMIAARIESGTAQATTNRQRAAISGIFSFAIFEGLYAGTNPVRRVRRFRETQGRTRYLTEQEAQRLLNAASEHLKPLILAALMTGGRRGELLALTWADLDLDAAVLWFRSGNTKSRRERLVPLTPIMVEAFRRMGPGAPSERVFRFRGRNIGTVRRSFTRARTRAGLGKDVTFHVCRHSYASWAMMNGLDPYRLQKYLGHSSMTLTARYSHLSPEYLKDGARFFGPPNGDGK